MLDFKILVYLIPGAFRKPFKKSGFETFNKACLLEVTAALTSNIFTRFVGKMSFGVELSLERRILLESPRLATSCGHGTAPCPEFFMGSTAVLNAKTSMI